MKKDEENVTSALAGQPEIYEHIGTLANDVLRKHGVESSGPIALDICKEFCNQFGGQQVYLPLARDLERLERDRKIYLEFSGNNIPALASKYRLSAMQIRNILQKPRSCVKQTKQTHGE